MLFNKKRFLSLFSVVVALPLQASPTTSKTTTTTTTTSTSKGSSNATISVTLPFSKSKGEEIAGGVAVVIALTVCWKIYKVLGGTKSFQQFLTEANAQAQKAVEARDTAEKLAAGKSYQGLSEADKNSILDKAYENYVVDNSARLLGVNGTDFKSYINKLAGDTFVAKMQTAQGVVQTLSSDARSAIPDAKPGELPFKSALRYAIENSVLDQAQAGPIAQSFPKTVEVNLSTGEGPSGEIGSAVGRGVDNFIAGTADAASSAAVSAYQNLANATRVVQRQAGLASDAYSGQVAARAQAAQASVQRAQQSITADQNVARINNDTQRNVSDVNEEVDVDPIKPVVVE